MSRESTLSASRILLVIGGGIAAYKALDLIRRLRERGAKVRVVMTPAAKQFVTPLSAAALSGDKVYDDLFIADRRSRDGPYRIVARGRSHRRRAGHRRSSRAHGQRPRRRSRLDRLAGDRQESARRPGDELAHVAASGDAAQRRAASPTACCSSARTTATWLAANMGRAGWPSRWRSSRRSRRRSPGRPPRLARRNRRRAGKSGPLAGRHVLVTSGPTYEPIDPVRFIGNRSSGLQGHAIARGGAAPAQG